MLSAIATITAGGTPGPAITTSGRFSSRASTPISEMGSSVLTRTGMGSFIHPPTMPRFSMLAT